MPAIQLTDEDVEILLDLLASDLLSHVMPKAGVGDDPTPRQVIRCCANRDTRHDDDTIGAWTLVFRKIAAARPAGLDEPIRAPAVP
jgi:hypothetical protein